MSTKAERLLQQKKRRQAEQERHLAEAHQDVAGALGLASDTSVEDSSTENVSDTSVKQMSTTQESDTSVRHMDTTNVNDTSVVHMSSTHVSDTKNGHINGTQDLDTKNVHINSTQEIAATDEAEIVGLIDEFKASRKGRQTVEETHTRKTFIVRNDLLRELDELTKTQPRGFQMWFVNRAFELLIDELKSQKDKPDQDK